MNCGTAGALRKLALLGESEALERLVRAGLGGDRVALRFAVEVTTGTHVSAPSSEWSVEEWAAMGWLTDVRR